MHAGLCPGGRLTSRVPLSPRQRGLDELLRWSGKLYAIPRRDQGIVRIDVNFANPVLLEQHATGELGLDAGRQAVKTESSIPAQSRLPQQGTLLPRLSFASRATHARRRGQLSRLQLGCMGCARKVLLTSEDAVSS